MQIKTDVAASIPEVLGRSFKTIGDLANALNVLLQEYGDLPLNLAQGGNDRSIATDVAVVETPQGKFVELYA